MERARRGKCSLMRIPGTLVAISLNGPPLAWPGFRSNVSIWLGPPLIQSRMHAFLRCGCEARSSASRSSQPESEEPTAPAEVNRSQSRRESGGSSERRTMIDPPETCPHSNARRRNPSRESSGEPIGLRPLRHDPQRPSHVRESTGRTVQLFRGMGGGNLNSNAGLPLRNHRKTEADHVDAAF